MLINTLAHEPKAPFVGFKQSDIGREVDYGSLLFSRSSGAGGRLRALSQFLTANGEI
ncbi:hypothetical protein [Microvirga sp.]|uniref:hypothetical protein n=1 Tax=Microvirga sp. TaxID=1873136 RepID=UPI00391D116C